MIIECQTCHARFRLDESRIKGRGARVKCRKCGDSIVVLKGGAPEPAPPSPGGDGSFDLSSAVRDTAEMPASPSRPTVGNLIPFPAPSRPDEPAAPAGGPAQAREKDEVDLVFDRLLSGGGEEPSPATGETEAEAPPYAEDSVPAEREAPAPPEPPSGLDLGTLTLDFKPEEKLDLPPAHAGEPPLGEQQRAEVASEFRAEGGFLISDSETLDFLKEDRPAAGSKAPPLDDDFSRAISSALGGEADSFPREPGPPPPPPEDWTSAAPGAIPLEGNATPLSAPGMDAPPRREAGLAQASPDEPPVLRGFPAPESPRPRSSAGLAIAAGLAFLLAAAGYLGLTASGRKTLEGAVPGVAALWGGKAAAPEESKYDLRNVIGYYESGVASPRILVIKGQVANLSGVEKSSIRVLAAMMDNTEATMVQQVVYAGNVLSGEAIRKWDRDRMTKALGNRFGEGLANMHVAPGKAIPFMVVFFDAPANIDSYKLEAKDGE
jgi:predicted Zn finger-like uncharacterized protein